VSMTVDTESERLIPAYGGKASREMFVLAIFRCPACGSTGKADSWCEGHSAPLELAVQGESLRVKREPVLVPHAEPESTTTEPYEYKAAQW
jgi:hypothetical protein